MLVAFILFGFSFVCSCLNTQRCFQYVYNYVLGYKQKQLEEDKKSRSFSIYKGAKHWFLMGSYVFLVLNSYAFLWAVDFLYNSYTSLLCAFVWLFFSLYFVAGYGQFRIFNVLSVLMGVGFFFLGVYQLVFFVLVLALFLVMVHLEYILYLSFSLFFCFLLMEYPLSFALSASLSLLVLSSFKCRQVAKKESLNWVKRFRAGS